MKTSLFRPSGIGLVLALAAVAAGAAGPGSGDGTVAAQAATPCALVTTDDVRPLASKNATVSDGVAASVQSVGSSTCRFTWGDDTGRHKLDVTLHDAARMYAGQGPDAIKQGLQATVRKDTVDSAIEGVGETAVFTADSAAFVHATAFVKGRILQVILDGYDARDRKDQVVALLSSAASKL